MKQATACTKEDLARLAGLLYSTASTTTDYQDTTLLVLLCSLLGRALDLTMTQKQYLSVYSNETFFVRSMCVNTSEEQGLSLFPDAAPHPSPTTTLAVALALQATTTVSLLPHLPAPTHSDVDALGSLVSPSSVLG